MEQYKEYKSCIACGAVIDYNEEVCYNCGDDGFGEYMNDENSDGEVLCKK
jgi:RNA polymerase subunit RPABC4/transcription elongation factor Spt4